MNDRQYYQRLGWLAFVFTLLLLILLGGCTTQKRCFKKWPPQVTTVIERDTVITYKDTTVYIDVPADTVYSDVPVYIIDTVEGEPVVVSYDSAKAETQYAEAVAWVERSRVQLELRQKDSLIGYRLDSIIAIKEHYVNLYTTEVHKQPVEKIKCPVHTKVFIFILGFLAGGAFVILFRGKRS